MLTLRPPPTVPFRLSCSKIDLTLQADGGHFAIALVPLSNYWESRAYDDLPSCIHYVHANNKAIEKNVGEDMALGPSTQCQLFLERSYRLPFDGNNKSTEGKRALPSLGYASTMNEFNGFQKTRRYSKYSFYSRRATRE